MPEIIDLGSLKLRFLQSKDDTAGSIDMFEMTLQPNARMPIPHYHDRWDETIYGLTGVSTWRVIDLCGIVRERFGVSYSESGLAKLLHGLDLSWQTPRPQHPQSDAAAQAAFKKSSGRCSIGLPPHSQGRSGLRSGSWTKPVSARRVG